MLKSSYCPGNCVSADGVPASGCHDAGRRSPGRLNAFRTSEDSATGPSHGRAFFQARDFGRPGARGGTLGGTERRLHPTPRAGRHAKHRLRPAMRRKCGGWVHGVGCFGVASPKNAPRNRPDVNPRGPIYDTDHVNRSTLTPFTDPIYSVVRFLTECLPPAAMTREGGLRAARNHPLGQRATARVKAAARLAPTGRISNVRKTPYLIWGAPAPPPRRYAPRRLRLRAPAREGIRYLRTSSHSAIECPSARPLRF
jgi:hypothetical protein